LRHVPLTVLSCTAVAGFDDTFAVGNLAATSFNSDVAGVLGKMTEISVLEFSELRVYLNIINPKTQR
jgi:hypothetical protein